ncbi:MAG: phosphatidylglycerophosphatase A [Pseudomonadota bacterium]|jgi:phosphatidylglycerophosphatase A|nr:phosphatidylglycerophosphatase A [Pseudomonadota bacterium]
MGSRLKQEDTTISELKLSNLRDPAVFWASGLGVGFARPAPGTWGSIFAVAIWWLLLSELGVAAQAAVIAIYLVSAVVACQRVCTRYGVDDASEMVADEVVGMWIALLTAPKVWWICLVALALFRLMDVLKPGPVGWLDSRIKGGIGVILDDVVAGAFVCAFIWLLVSSLRGLGFMFS